MNSQNLLEEKEILFRKYREFTLEQQNALKKDDIEGIQKLVAEKKALTKQIQGLEPKLVNEGIDQSALEPLIREVLELEESISSEIARKKSALSAESGNLRKGQRAIKQYLQ